MTERVQHAIDIFLDSLNNNTLISGSCIACAVGNLVADAFGVNLTPKRTEDQAILVEADNYNPKELDHKNITVWSKFFMTDGSGIQTLNFDGSGLSPSAHKAMDTICKKTGFTIKELAVIEHAFETNCKDESIMCYWPDELKQAEYIKGLTAVVKVMMEFDNVQEEVEEVFTKKAKAIYA